MLETSETVNATDLLNIKEKAITAITVNSHSLCKVLPVHKQKLLILAFHLPELQYA